MKLYFTLYSFFFFSIVYSQQDTIYFNHNWRICTKDSAQFYRLPPLKIETKTALGYKIRGVDSLYVIRDFYKSNTIQMSGFSYDKDAKFLVGEIYWYREDKSLLNYENRNANKAKTINIEPIVYLEYLNSRRNQFSGGVEICLSCKQLDKLFLGIGYSIENYGNKLYNSPNFHISYNSNGNWFLKLEGSNKYISPQIGLSFLNFMDFGIGYSIPTISANNYPVLNGFTAGILIRLSRKKKTYGTFSIGW